ncbi:MAG: 2-oxo acid dehydrogenase subunit E2 [Spirochaetales bacterium]|nr:2-oxo acid dehydrogenase subunit E2 [Spirochaetales bacterium]
MGRKDGKRVKNADPMYTIVPYIMNKRYDSMNMINLDIPVDPIKDYIKEKRSQGVYVSHLSVIIASYLRAMAHFPLLNRFIVNCKIYARKDIDCAMVVLKDEDGEMEGTMSKIRLEEEDTIFTVNDKLTKYIDKNREAKNKNSTDRMIKKLLAFPGLARFGVGLFKFMDKHGLLPAKVIDASPFHTSFTITNLASLRTNYIYHHIYEFGTTSVFIAMGNTREVPFRTKNGVEFRTCIPLGVVMDERICSGHYYAEAFKCMKKYPDNPRLLEKTFSAEGEK